MQRALKNMKVYIISNRTGVVPNSALLEINSLLLVLISVNRKLDTEMTIACLAESMSAEMQSGWPRASRPACAADGQ
jgi:hypothetical protein